MLTRYTEDEPDPQYVPQGRLRILWDEIVERGIGCALLLLFVVWFLWLALRLLG